MVIVLVFVMEDETNGKYYIHNIFTILSQQIIGGKLLLVLIYI